MKTCYGCKYVKYSITDEELFAIEVYCTLANEPITYVGVHLNLKKFLPSYNCPFQ